MYSQNISESLVSVTTEDVTYSRNVMYTDLEKNNQIPVCSCNCSISSGTSISVYISVLNPLIFEKRKDIIQAEVDAFVFECKALAQRHNVPVVEV